MTMAAVTHLLSLVVVAPLLILSVVATRTLYGAWMRTPMRIADDGAEETDLEAEALLGAETDAALQLKS